MRSSLAGPLVLMRRCRARSSPYLPGVGVGSVARLRLA